MTTACCPRCPQHSFSLRLFSGLFQNGPVTPAVTPTKSAFSLRRPHTLLLRSRTSFYFPSFNLETDLASPSSITPVTLAESLNLSVSACLREERRLPLRSSSAPFPGEVRLYQTASPNGPLAGQVRSGPPRLPSSACFPPPSRSAKLTLLSKLQPPWGPLPPRLFSALCPFSPRGSRCSLNAVTDAGFPVHSGLRAAFHPPHLDECRPLGVTRPQVSP